MRKHSGKLYKEMERDKGESIRFELTPQREEAQAKAGNVVLSAKTFKLHSLPTADC
jgi:hypothetical protein